MTKADLVDIPEIAARLGYPKDTINKWRFRGLFPEPDYEFSAVPVWYWRTVLTWAKRTGRIREQ